MPIMLNFFVLSGSTDSLSTAALVQDLYSLSGKTSYR